jgi:hypothetical protein
MSLLMKSREILLVVLIVAIALGSGLIGLYLGRSSVQQAAAPPAEQAIEPGEPVAAGKVRLFGDAQKTNLAFEIENNRVYQGTVSQGQPVLFFNGTTVFLVPMRAARSCSPSKTAVFTKARRQVAPPFGPSTVSACMRVPLTVPLCT